MSRLLRRDVAALKTEPASSRSAVMDGRSEKGSGNEACCYVAVDEPPADHADADRSDEGDVRFEAANSYALHAS
jgi:hypothetical protein